MKTRFILQPEIFWLPGRQAEIVKWKTKGYNYFSGEIHGFHDVLSGFLDRDLVLFTNWNRTIAPLHAHVHATVKGSIIKEKFIKSTGENDWLHLRILAQDPQKEASQVEGVDELTTRRAGSPDRQRLDISCKHSTCVMYHANRQRIFCLRFAMWTLCMSPGRTWPSSILKLSWGPNTLVGMTAVKLQPCCW